MYRYIALAWDPQRPDMNSRANNLMARINAQTERWENALQADGFHVYHSKNRPGNTNYIALSQNSGVVLGNLFPTHPDYDYAPRDNDFDDRETDRIVASNGRHLVRNYWGRYIAFIRKQDTGAHLVIRDPSGALPCQITNYHGVDIIFSEMEDCVSIGVDSFSIDWAYIVAFFAFNRLVTARTGFTEVQSVHAGQCVTVGAPNTAPSFHWDPNAFAAMDAIEDMREARSRLKRAVRRCTQAWASAYGRILHELSGGLDSSIVLSCLSEIDSFASRVTAINIYTPTNEGDERVYARLAARRAACELIEAALPNSHDHLEKMLVRSVSPAPNRATLYSNYRALRDRTVAAGEFEVIFSGQGGDHFFQQARETHIAAEYVERHGLRLAAWRVIADTARFTRRPTVSIVRDSLRRGIFRRRSDLYKNNQVPDFVHADFRDALDPALIHHPWLAGADSLPDSKRKQIYNIIDSQHFYDKPCLLADTVHPLISQPIIELSLRIPTYILAYGGVDRALMRDAFTGDVPHQILQRTSKGETTSFHVGMLVENRSFLREYLLGGMLVENGVLVKHRIERLLQEGELMRVETSQILRDALFVETWLRIAETLSTRRAA